MISNNKISKPEFILASSSPFRKNLLAKILTEFTAVAPNIDETVCSGESPQQTATRLAEEKARAVVEKFPTYWIIGSDQVALCASRILGKPGCRTAAVDQLRFISGKEVTFHTSVCVLSPGGNSSQSEIDNCKVKFKQLTEVQIQHYVARDQPYNCAASFKSEGFGIVLIERIIGEDPNALVGLPLIKLIKILEQFDINLF